MPHARPIVIPCRIVRGSCCGELAFVIELLDESTHAGFAPADHFWHLDGSPVGEGDLPPAEGIAALLAAYLIGEEGFCALISVPEGFIGLVNRTVVRARPARSGRA